MNSSLIWRWRRVRAGVVRDALADALADVVGPIVGVDQYSDWMESLVKMWIAGKPSAIKRVANYLTSAKLTFDAVIDAALEQKLGTIEQIDRLVGVAESRRNTVLREIDRHRLVLAQMLRSKLKDAEDAEFESVAPKAIGQNTSRPKDAA